MKYLWSELCGPNPFTAFQDLAKQKQLMFQKKASWWKEFDWVGGVMVELDWVNIPTILYAENFNI